MKSYIPRTLQEVELREKEFRAHTSVDLEENLYAKLTGLTVAQKRVRVGASSSRSRTASDSSVARAGALDAASKNQDMSLAIDGELDHGDVVDLEVPLSEPATVRGLPKKDKSQVRTMSPVTSSSSLRPQEDRPDAERLSKMLEQQSRMDHIGFFAAVDPGSTLVHEAAITETVTGVEESDIFPDNDRSETSSGELWLRPHREEPMDPYEGLSKKEWKKRIKAENREKREKKTPKHVKKRKEVLAKRRRGTK
ncbi:unnamed protein product [Chondrus crispus]|uniref:Uncharacterized protein n=1 Tax=Chondrus crispus TaxID=2769 RepID=R7QQW6_CHOCR|nr:unnamed protein product [Chondrus crispus]CDF39785.1 unnamed protein product [Chondrus crispus]|eukprot:XP_005710079.1 unnamed protein product [Chondrus crispus]